MTLPHTNSSNLKRYRIIGIDYGMKRIGLALSDESSIIATPLTTFQAERKIENTIKNLVAFLQNHAKENRYEIASIVIGLPLMMSGKNGVLADEVLHFISLLKVSLPVPITPWDERLSSVQADRSLREGPFTRRKRSTMVDNIAATIILQSYLDRENFKRNEESS